MKIKDFIKKLKEFDQEATVLLGSDEELNNVFSDVQVANYGSSDNSKNIVLWGNTGSEVE